MRVVTAPAVSTAKAFCPGHITGFLAKTSDLNSLEMLTKAMGKDNFSYLHKGSLGAGLAIDLGITTTVRVYERENYTGTTFDVLINGLVKNSNIEVTKNVLEKYTEHLAGEPYHIRIEHETSIPIGYGLSSSGAAALSLSYALNIALKAGLDLEKAAQIAHCAEVECGTGLGSVVAQYLGGFEVRSVIGAPGIGLVHKIPDHYNSEDLKVVISCLSPVSTRKFLTEHVEPLNGFGRKMLDRLGVSRDIGEFLDMSFDYAKSLGLIRSRTASLITRLKSQGFGCSVALFGDTIFSIVNSSSVDDVVSCLKVSGSRLLVAGIDQYGARVIDK